MLSVDVALFSVFHANIQRLIMLLSWAFLYKYAEGRFPIILSVDMRGFIIKYFLLINLNITSIYNITK